MRVDGILRGLGGLFAGAFTTTARDAIALGSRPFTLVIFNITTNQFEYNAGTDTTPNWQPVAPPLGTGSVTSTMILDGTIVNADVNAAAAIAYAKLNLALAIVNGDISAVAAIAYSKLALASSIVHGDIAAANKDGAAATPSMRTLGTGSAQAAAGNDSRLSDTRVPTDNTVTNVKIVDNTIADVKLALSYMKAIARGHHVESGVVTSADNFSAGDAVTFTTAFSSAPHVTCSRDAGTGGPAVILPGSITTTGFIMKGAAWYDYSGSGCVGYWIAEGA
jgi:hypothetical protein